MKKFTLVFVLSFLIQLIASAQPCLPGGITFTTQAEIDDFSTNYPNCTEIGGDVIIEGTTINNVKGLNAITSIDGNLEIFDCNALSSLSGLDNITTIEDNLILISNDILFSFLGLEGLKTIGGDFELRVNEKIIEFNGLDNLTSIGGTFWVWQNGSLSSFSGLESLTSIGEGLIVGIYGWPSGTWGNQNLASLSGLENLTSVSGDLQFVGNPNLRSLTGIDNIDAASIADLTIAHNILLTKCEVQSVCDYLVAPNGTVSIEVNDNGCSSQAEVEYECSVVGIDDIDLETEFSIYPNPAETTLSISSENGLTIDEVSIYNQIGQKVFFENHNTNELDISTLQPGVYVIMLNTNNLDIRRKLIVK